MKSMTMNRLQKLVEGEKRLKSLQDDLLKAYRENKEVSKKREISQNIIILMYLNGEINLPDNKAKEEKK